MNKKADAAGADPPIIVLSGPDRGSVQNLRKTSMETRSAIASLYSLFTSIPGFLITSYQHFPEKNGPLLHVDISCKDNSPFGRIRAVMEHRKKNKTGTIAETIELEIITAGSIIKVRGMARINQLSESVLSKVDIQLPSVYTGREGVLFGSARMAQESGETFDRLNRSEEIERKKCELESKRKLMENGIAVLNKQYEHRRREKVLVGPDLITRS